MDDDKKGIISKATVITALVGGILAIVGFFFTYFVPKGEFEAKVSAIEASTLSEISRVENVTADVLQEIITNLDELRLEQERSRTEIVLQTLKIRRDFLRSRDTLSSTEQRELDVLDSNIDELLAILN